MDEEHSGDDKTSDNSFFNHCDDGPSKSLILTAGLLQTASRIIGLTVPGLCAVLTLGSLATGNTIAGMQSEF